MSPAAPSDLLDDAPLTRRSGLLELLVVCAAVAAFYWTHLDLTRMQGGGDFANLFWPIKEFRLQVVRECGVIPLWNPYTFLGSPLAATMQHAIYYPIDYLFFWRSPTLPAMNLYIVFHAMLCGAGTWWWVRRGWGRGAIAAVLAGITFPCTAWFWGAQEHINQTGTVAWMPWLLGVAVRWGRGKMSSRCFVLAYSMLGAMQFFVGHPQAAFYTHALAGLLVVAGGLVSRVPPEGGTTNGEGVTTKDRVKSFVARLAPFAAAVALMGLLIGVQLLPALELSSLAARHHHDPRWSYSYSMPPDLLKTYLLPHAFGDFVKGYQDERAYNEYGLFVGAPVMLLAAGAIAFALARRGRQWRATTMMAALIVLTLLMAMGGNMSFTRIFAGDFTEFPDPGGWSLHDLYVKLMPLAAGFRVPARIVIVTALCWTTIAGFGAELLVAAARRRAAGPVITILVVTLPAAAWLALYLPSRGERFRFPVDSAPLLLAWEQDKGFRESATIDNRMFRLTINDDAILKTGRQLATEEELGVNTVALRWTRWFENNNVVEQLPSVGGYEEGLLPVTRYKDFLFTFNRNLRQFTPDAQFLALLGVGTIYTDLPVDNSIYTELPQLSRPGWTAWRVPTHKGAAFWARQAEGIDFKKLDATFWPNKPFPEIPNDVPVPFGSAPHWNDKGFPKLTTDTTNPNHVVITSDGEWKGEVLLAMAWYPGWRGIEASIQDNGAALSTIHKIGGGDNCEIQYQPSSYRVGLFLSVLGTLILVFGAARKCGAV